MKLSMYFWAILTLSIVTAAAIITRNEQTMNISIAVITAVLLDVAIKKFYIKKDISFPSSAFITGLIIGGVAPFDAAPLVLILASSVAILSKFFLRLKGSHIFNPAALGLVISLAIFGLGDEWWVAASYNVLGYAIVLTPLLFIPNYRAGKLKIAIPFLAVSALMIYITDVAQIGLITGSISALVLSLPFYYALIMVSEPKTSPFRPKEQIIFGIAIALLYFAMLWQEIIYAPLIALLIGNAGYFVYKNYLRKS